MFSATHTYDSVNYVTGKLMVSIDKQRTDNSTESTNDLKNNYKLNTPDDFIINNTNRYNQYICLVTPYYTTINHLIFPFIHMRHPMNSNIAAQIDSTYVRIRQTTKDYRLDFRGSYENYRGNVDVVFFSSRAHISDTLLFERFKIKSTEDAIITGLNKLDSNAEYELTNFDSNDYNLFFTPFLNSSATNPDSITINFSIKIFSDTDNYTIKALGKDGDNNDDGYFHCAGKHFFWVAINKNIHNYYKKDENPIIITGQSSNYFPSYVDISSYSLGDNDYTLLLSPIDSTDNEMISLQIMEKTSTKFRIIGFVKDSGSGKTGGRQIVNGDAVTFQWAIIRETIK
jgi:hypothetical protein